VVWLSGSEAERSSGKERSRVRSMVVVAQQKLRSGGGQAKDERWQGSGARDEGSGGRKWHNSCPAWALLVQGAGDSVWAARPRGC